MPLGSRSDSVHTYRKGKISILIWGEVVRSGAVREGFAVVEGKAVRWYGVVSARRVYSITTVIGPFTYPIPGVPSPAIYERRIVMFAR